jgi:hypothetical protein
MISTTGAGIPCAVGRGMRTTPAQGDFVVELLHESAYFIVRREGANALPRHQFDSYVSAVSFACERADDRDVRAFLKTGRGWRCLDSSH